MKVHYKNEDPVELEVTSFMNLMIVLVPVLLLSMTFTQITVMEISLPELTGGEITADNPQSQMEVVVDEDGIKVFYPENILLQDIPTIQTDQGEAYNFAQLSRIMQAVKQKYPDKRDALVLSKPSVSYQDLVSTLSAVKSYKTVVAASVVEVELFPEISLDDAK